MSAPVVERIPAPRQGSRTRTATVPAQRGVTGLAPGRQPGQKSGAQRAYAKRDERNRRLTGERSSPAGFAGRSRFVVLVMVLLVASLVATLWLSTAAAADSYRLQDARTAERALNEQSERLHREVATMSSPPALAERAAGLGMVPMQDAARLVVGKDGTVQVVGTPMAAPVPPPPPAPEPAADSESGAGSGAAVPAEHGATDGPADGTATAKAAADGATAGQGTVKATADGPAAGQGTARAIADGAPAGQSAAGGTG